MIDPVFSTKVNGPATHALVIGVGHYPHLPGGGGKQYANPEGMGQIKSPPQSARTFAKWLIEGYECDERPLASVTMLIAEKTPAKFLFERKGKKASVSVPEATMPNVADAIKNTWLELGAKNHENLLLFYFCGHGVGPGHFVSLLMQDFGADANAPLDGALDFRKFYNAMDDRLPRHQCYFVDACRSESTLIQKNPDGAGLPVLNGDPLFIPPNGLLRLGPIFYSALANAKAYARPKEPSLFTQALLEALGGAGSGDEEDAWKVKTSHIQTAITYLMKEASRTLDIPLTQVPALGGDSGVVVLNTLQTPAVPVFVEVDPADAHLAADLSVAGPVTMKRKKAEKLPWKIVVEPGQYDIIADFTTPPYKKTQISDSVRPPYRAKKLKAVP